MNGRGCYCSSPFQRFYENPIQASNSQVYNPSPFQRFYENPIQASNSQAYNPSPFQRFYENPIQASNSQAYNPSPFQRFYGNSLQASQLHSTQASTVRGLLFSELNAVFAAKHFIFFIFPILLKLKTKENDPMIGRSCLQADVSYFLCCTRRQRTTKS